MTFWRLQATASSKTQSTAKVWKVAKSGAMNSAEHNVQPTFIPPALQEPLRTFMLPHLSPQVILALRRACQTTQLMVDHDTAQLWSAIALRLGVPQQHLPKDPPDVHAVHAALHQQAAIVSRIRRWDASIASPHADLLRMFNSNIQLKLNWLWHADVTEGLSCRYLVVQDGIPDGVPCYDSETESGSWEVSFPASGSAPYPQMAVVELTSREAAVMYQRAGLQRQFHCNCCHAFDVQGEAHLICGAYASSQGRVTHRLRMFRLEIMTLYGPYGEDDDDYFAWPMHVNEYDPDPELLNPEPDWQQDITWQTEAESASVAGCGSFLAWQTDRCSLTIFDMTSCNEAASMSYDAAALRGSDISSLQWSSSGEFLAIGFESPAWAQLILVEKHSWQQIACHEYGKGLCLLWGPTKPSLAILHGNTAEAPEDLLKNSAHADGANCRWDLEGRYLVVLGPSPCTYDIGSAIIFDTMTEKQSSAKVWKEAKYGVMTSAEQDGSPTFGLPALQEPLSTFMFPYLTPQSLLALRQACQTTQRVIDHDHAQLWSALALRQGVAHQRLPKDPLDVYAVYAALHQQSAHVARVRHWDASITSPNPSLLAVVNSSIQLKLTWLWHADVTKGKCCRPSCRYLVVQDGIPNSVPYYDSDSESGSSAFQPRGQPHTPKWQL
ncbi:hypothetical protein WJX74_010492 [Apatococcus lobatus]|uniref:F-box domain-containing protein n=1 Tax=Apatococcus lobatus TaxID=904363 RepID=A0AAW1QLS0_9CHLO